MIQAETDILNAVADEVETAFPGIFVSNVPMLIPAEFPCIAVYERDNAVDASKADSSHVEKFAVLTYVVEVCSNRRTGAKGEARAILDIADEVMYNLNFTRVGIVTNEFFADADHYRITARYTAEAGRDGVLYRR